MVRTIIIIFLSHEISSEKNIKQKITVRVEIIEKLLVLLLIRYLSKFDEVLKKKDDINK